MTLPLLRADEFAADAALVRRAVLEVGFETRIGPDGAPYSGICDYQVPHWHSRIAAVVGFPIVPRLCCFRLNLAGELPHSWVHSDDICAQFASVLYLNPPEQCSGGTAFWRHKGLGMDRLLSRDELTARGCDPEAFYELMTREWKRIEPWEQVALVPMVWNRFISYRTSLFHSRFPFEGFGSGPGDGRLIWVCFFDRQTEAQ